MFVSYFPIVLLSTPSLSANSCCEICIEFRNSLMREPMSILALCHSFIFLLHIVACGHNVEYRNIKYLYKTMITEKEKQLLDFFWENTIDKNGMLAFMGLLKKHNAYDEMLKWFSQNAKLLEVADGEEKFSIIAEKIKEIYDRKPVSAYIKRK